MYREDDSLRERLDNLEKKIDGLASGTRAPFYGYEYKSKFRLFGMPFIHVAHGFDPVTGGMRVARGFIAIGNVAIGVFALGGIALGIFSVGGISLGIAALGGMAFAVVAAFGGMAVGGYLALGGLAVSGYIAVGGMAMSWNYAYGGFAIGKFPYGENIKDPQALEFLKSLFPDWKW
jgi:hypothetical protein